MRADEILLVVRALIVLEALFVKGQLIQSSWPKTLNDLLLVGHVQGIVDVDVCFNLPQAPTLSALDLRLLIRGQLVVDVVALHAYPLVYVLDTAWSQTKETALLEFDLYFFLA